MLIEQIEKIRAKKPVIHCITNYVTANDCANVLLACGASPIMADAPEDAADIAALADGLVINIGTLNQQKLEAMLIAGRTANSLGKPVVLDPVGAGASKARTDAALRLISEVDFTVIRGNSSEIKTLALGSAGSRGVDADLADAVAEADLPAAAAFAKRFASQTGAVIAITGAIDVIADAERAAAVYNGDPMLRRITGAGCMTTCLCAAFAACANDRFISTVSAITAMGVCGEIAKEKLGIDEGTITFRNNIIDIMSYINSERIDSRKRIIEL